ncbi:MAG: 23S rRNA (adenine(2503)-C(2))-methyltransferase RlmN [Bacteroidales bacterium]
MKEKLYGKTQNELALLVRDLGLPSYTLKQITDWLYKKDISSIEEMSNLSKDVRRKLGERFEYGLQPAVKVQVSTDGTRKYLFPGLPGKFIETAYIPDEDRATVCVSSQVGCKMGCLFCMTGKQGFQGNLSAGEILNQYRSIPEYHRVTNLVYMGMGEPMDNLEAVLASLEILTSDWGYAMSPRRITVSTIGVIPAMVTFLEKSQCHLAVSLHTPFDDERRRLMPIQTVFPVKEVVSTLKKFDLGKQRRISFEYILFGGLNDTPRHVNELARLLNGLRCRINLIRFHPIPDTPLRASTDPAVLMFKEKLNAKGILTTVRASRGQDIYAACGLLSTKELVKKSEEEW